MHGSMLNFEHRILRNYLKAVQLSAICNAVAAERRCAKTAYLPNRVADTSLQNSKDGLYLRERDAAEQPLTPWRRTPHPAEQKPSPRGAGAHPGASGKGLGKGCPDYFFRPDFCSCLRIWPYRRLLSLSASLVLVRVSICRSLAFIWSSNCCLVAAYRFS